MQNLYKETMEEIINQQAEQLYHKLNLNPGFDLDGVIEKLGGTIEEEKDLEESVDAKILPDFNGESFKIICVSKENEYRRLAIAHELGHLFLHMAKVNGKDSYIIEGTYQHERENTSMIEWEAEEFALAFLMPEQVFRNKVEEIDANEKYLDKIQELSRLFKVPYKSVIVRRKSLDI